MIRFKFAGSVLTISAILHKQDCTPEQVAFYMPDPRPFCLDGI